MSHFGKRCVLWQRRQERIMSWNAKCVWGRRMKLALLLVLTPTFEHLMPRLQENHLITLTDGNSNLTNYHLIFAVIEWKIKTTPSDFEGFCSCTLKFKNNGKTETIRSTKLDSYHHYTAVLRMSSCYSRSWSPPTAADTHPGWHMSPPGTWCWGLSMEINSNFVSRL